ncbi:hypothetical protein CNEO_740009 [Clostridium neonatale]|nr:hypothetical protein CNEO_740009 [Clostridium neonatale]
MRDFVSPTEKIPERIQPPIAYINMTINKITAMFFDFCETIS